jgi:hypothetical protein
MGRVSFELLMGADIEKGSISLHSYKIKKAQDQVYRLKTEKDINPLEKVLK